jgi:hypothetical protein
MSFARMFAAIPAGLLAMAIVVTIIELLGKAIFPPSPEMLAAIERIMKGDPAGRDAAVAALPSMPTGTYVSVVLAWIAGACAGAFTGGKVAGTFHRTIATGIGALTTLAVAANVFLIPHPQWVVVAGLVLPMTAAIALGLHLQRKHRHAAAEAFRQRIS